MDVNAHDVHICLCKILNFSLKICASICTKHPYASICFLSLILLYISFPFVFWALIYSIPVVVSSFIILSLPANGKNKYTHEEEDEENEREKEEEIDGNSKFASDDSSDHNKTKNIKSYKRVHSVRRRRAKNFVTEEANNKVEDKNAVASTNFNDDDMVDKNALTQVEEIPKEIREVQVDYASPKTDIDDHNPNNIQEILKEESKDEKKEDDKEEEDDNNDNDKNHVIDIGISATKRLESLIARRRSRKLLSLQVRRTLMNMDKTDRPPQIASIVIPRNNSSMNLNGPYSPGPGSAPSVLVPMRNPFDLPYDPQEEKPDLTGDGFDQEFMTPNANRDMVFCRHESFSLGPFLPGEYYQNRDVFNHDFGFRQRNSSSMGFHPPFSNPGHDFEKKFTFTPIMEQESYEVSESKSNIDSPDDDHIKEVIQVYENGIHSHSEQQDSEKDTNTDEVEEEEEEEETRPITEDNPSTSSSAPSSSEEDVQVFKIDKEAILKSLSSMARRNPVQDSNEPIDEQLMMNYETCSYDHNSSRLNEQFYYGDDDDYHKHMRHHTNSFSIASDLQVEVSEVSSPPPLTIDENDDQYTSSYDGDTEKKITNWDDHDLWPSSSPNIQES